ncbi:enoyl-CoA hydratase/isomerase family protein [Thermodesulfobacteriota bacterium]
MGKYNTILLDIKDNVATITLNRPDKMNAINDELMEELPAAFAEADADEDVRVIVLTGGDKVFCTGYDIEGGDTKYADLDVPIQGALTIARAGREKYLDIINTRKPTIARVKGYCFAGGCYLQMLCDVTIAAEDAIFGHPAVASAGPTGFPLWVWYLGAKKAKEFLFTGRFVDGKEAEKIGLINLAVPPDKLDEEVALMAKDMAAVPTDVITLHKESVNTILEIMGLSASFRTQSELNALGRYGAANLDIEYLRGATKDRLKRMKRG